MSGTSDTVAAAVEAAARDVLADQGGMVTGFVALRAQVEAAFFRTEDDE